MNVLVIGSKKSGSKNDPRTIYSALSGAVAAKLVYWEDLEFAIATNKVVVSAEGEDVLEGVDLVIAVGWYKTGRQSIYRDVAYSLALVLDQRGIRFWNSEMLAQRSTSKLSSMVQLGLSGVSVPDSYFSLNTGTVIKSLQPPYVIKSITASRGANNYLVKVADDPKIGNITQNDSYYIAQPYLPNDHDLRVICFGGKPRMVLKRSRRSGVETHLNNTSKGGEAEWLDLSEIPPALLTESEKICKIMKRELAGIDFISDANSPVGYSCLEVNAVPQLTSGHDAERKMKVLLQTITEMT